MVKSIDSLPSELLLDIGELLSNNDKINLIRTAGPFTILQAHLWRKIDLHPPTFHEQVEYYDEADSRWDFDGTAVPFPDEGYSYRQISKLQEASRQSTILFFEASYLRYTDPVRWSFLASHVTSLCVSLEFNRRICSTFTKPHEFCEINALNTILSFSNLECLTVIGEDSTLLDQRNYCAYILGLDNRVILPDPGVSHKPTKLRDVRLRGYLPAVFVRALVFSSSGIQTLDLGLLKCLSGRYLGPSFRLFTDCMSRLYMRGRSCGSHARTSTLEMVIAEYGSEI